MNIVRIGDPHLGRRFVNGVPLHRRGQRELEVNNTFRDRVMNLPAGTQMVVIYGDLFDKFIVDEGTKLFAASTLKEASFRHPHTHFVVLAGNHDSSRNLTLKSSFDVFVEMVASSNMIFPIKEATIIENIGFIPWHPFLSAAQQVTQLADDLNDPLDEVCGHWDIKSFNDDTHNLIPLAELAGITKKASTGHIHQKSTFKHGDLQVEVVGSMLPYAHGEDNDLSNPKYVTMTLMEYELHINKEMFKDKCLRLLLPPGTSAPENLDVLQLVTQRMVDITEDADAIEEVTLADFDFRTVFFEEMTRENVSPSRANQLWDSFSNARSL